jgi:hypothetical protein
MSAFQFVEYPPYGEPTLTSCRGLGELAAPGELLSAAFGIHADQSVADVSFTVSSLRGTNGREIADGAIDLRIVKVWAQAGVGVYQSASTLVPELLVKDDRVGFQDSYSSWCGHWNHALQRKHYYRPPPVDDIGVARTGLAVGETKQIWLSVRVPAECPAGMYEAQITATDGRDVCEMVFRLEVLPIALADATQDLFLWYKGTLDCQLPQHYLTPSAFEAQLRDIYAHGFRSISLNEPRVETRRIALEIAKRVGFRRNVVLTEPFDEVLDAREYAPLTPVYYLSDELDTRGTSAVAHHVSNWRDAKKTGARTMISLINASTARRFDASGNIGHAPDTFAYYLPANLRHVASAAAASGNASTYYYWLSHMEKPLVHRALAGVYLWKSGAAGIAPYCYQHLPQFPNSPFDDFDEWEPGFHVGQERRPFKDHMTTYPSRGGSIPTLQWKGLSDGITDLRYLMTLDAIVARALTAPSAAIRERAATVRARTNVFLDRVSLTDIDIVSETIREPYSGIAPADYRAFRVQMARDAVDLSALMQADAHNAGVSA